MNNEKQIQIRDESEPPLKLTRRGKALVWAAGTALSLGLGAGTAELNDSDFHGEQQMQITDENTITELVSENVDGVENGHLNATIHEAGERNQDTLGDGDIDHDDIGKTINLPKSVD